MKRSGRFWTSIIVLVISVALWHFDLLLFTLVILGTIGGVGLICKLFADAYDDHPNIPPKYNPIRAINQWIDKDIKDKR